MASSNSMKTEDPVSVQNDNKEDLWWPGNSNKQVTIVQSNEACSVTGFKCIHRVTYVK